MLQTGTLAIAAAFGLAGSLIGGLIAAAWLVENHAAIGATPRPVWTEASWPFSMDQWGTGKAFRCTAAHCGAEVTIYLRAKIGFCNCTTGVADDEELERLSDFELIGGDLVALGAGKRIAVAWMKGRSRSYVAAAPNRGGKAAISIAFNDRCDAIVATVALGHNRAAEIEPRVIAFLNGKTVLSWAEGALGL